MPVFLQTLFCNQCSDQPANIIGDGFGAGMGLLTGTFFINLGSLMACFLFCFVFWKGDCSPQKAVGLCQYRPASTGWFVTFHLWADLIKFVLKKGSYLAGKVEGCHLENGCVQAWEFALFGRWVCFGCESSKCNWLTHPKLKRKRKMKDQTII